MAIRFYIVPTQTGDGSNPNARSPKYITTHLAGVNWDAIDYGHEPCMIVRADVSAAQHALMAAETDVVAVPANLDNTIGASLALAQAALEDFKIPADWLTSGMTWRTSLRGVAAIFQLAQRFAGRNLGERMLDADTLDLRFNQLSQAKRNKLIDMADSLGLDRSGISGTSTLRQILRTLGQQWTAPLRIGEAL